MKKYFFALFFVVTATFCYAQDKIAYVNVQEFMGPIPEYQNLLKEGEDLNKAMEETLDKIINTTNLGSYERRDLLAEYNEIFQKTQDSLSMEFGNLYSYYSQSLGQVATAKGFVIIVDNSESDNPQPFWISPTIMKNPNAYLLEYGIRSVNGPNIIENNADIKELEKRFEKLQTDVIKERQDIWDEFKEASNVIHASKNRDEINLDEYEKKILDVETTMLRKNEELEERWPKLRDDLQAEMEKAIEKMKNELIKDAKSKKKTVLLDISNPYSPSLFWVAPSILENPKNELLQYANN